MGTPPCQPALFGEQDTPEVRAVMFALVVNAHRIIMAQVAMLELAIVEVVSFSILNLSILNKENA